MKTLIYTFLVSIAAIVIYWLGMGYVLADFSWPMTSMSWPRGVFLAGAGPAICRAVLLLGGFLSALCGLALAAFSGDRT